MVEENREPPPLLSTLNPLPGRFKPRARFSVFRPNSLTTDVKQHSCVSTLSAETVSKPDSKLMTIQSNASKIVEPFNRFVKRFSMRLTQSNTKLESGTHEPATTSDFSSWRRRRSHRIQSVVQERERSPLTSSKTSISVVDSKGERLLSDRTLPPKAAVQSENLSCVKRRTIWGSENLVTKTQCTPYPLRRRDRSSPKTGIRLRTSMFPKMPFSSRTSNEDEDERDENELPFEETTSTAGSFILLPPTGIDGPMSENTFIQPCGNDAQTSISPNYSLGSTPNACSSICTSQHTGDEVPTDLSSNITRPGLSSSSTGSPSTTSDLKASPETQLGRNCDAVNDSKAPTASSLAFKWTNHLRQSMSMANRRCRLLAAKTIFNENPVKGIAYLTENGLVPRVPVAVARFLLNEEGLSRQAIGEYFGSLNDPLATKVLKEFLKLQQMKGLRVDEALRLVLSYFHPLGESQKISFLMQVFQEEYVVQNDELVSQTFRSPETVEVLAYSLLLLHTDLHNPNLRRLGRQMTEQEFVNNNRGIDCDQDLPAELLRDMYHRIAETEFKTLPDPVDRVRSLDTMLVGPLKTANFFQRHRRFIGWVYGKQLNEIIPRRRSKRRNTHQRYVLIFNDIIIIAKQLNSLRLNSGSLMNLAAAAAYVEPEDDSSSLTTRRSGSVDSSTQSLQTGEYNVQASDQLLSCSTELMPSGNYDVRMVLTVLDLRVLVFESENYRHGVQLCGTSGPLLNINLTSAKARQKMIDWIHGSIAEMNELQRYHKTKRPAKISLLPSADQTQTSVMEEL
ncbi:unnamed protein product [Calicophoron daubneyi]|uniref:SEC7 domain-containing protein n=1 Tax=Calicophoron daubneyi TaxID=300641 RepID=A0AAV2T550_CALDB